MTKNRSSTVVSLGRGIGCPPHRLRLSLALACLAAVGLAQTGCRSDGCSSCSGFGSKLTSNVQALGSRVFTHKNKSNCSTCGTLGTTYEEGTVIDAGVPIVTTPGVVAVPPPSTIVAPPALQPDEQLSPLPPPASPAGPTSSTRGSTGTNRSAYEASRSRNDLLASKRGADLSRAYHPASPAPANDVSDQPDVFDNLPPVDLPTELTRKVTPIDPSAGGISAPSDPPPVVPVNDSNPKTSSAESHSAEDALVLPTQRVVTSEPVAVFPGMTRSAAVTSNISGGSLPSAEGLAWLKEKGYRTLVDLRPRSEVAPEFADQVNDAGMFYLALPFAPDPINGSRLAQFNELISQASQRPIYFFDGDGRRAGLAWYLRLRSQDHAATGPARSQAEPLGLRGGDIPAAEQFLKVNFAGKWGGDSVLTGLTPAVAASEPASTSVAPTGSQPAAVNIIPVLPPVKLARIDQLNGSRDVPFDRNPSWKPVAALVLSGLGVPLAYWSRTTLSMKRSPRRASLTAKGPGPRKSLPSSDA